MEPLWAVAARLSLPVFPCRSDKSPCTRHGFKDAETEPKKIRDLFLAHRGELIGVATGVTSGIDALDLDTARYPAEIDLWLRVNPLPVTRGHRTRSGGYHFLFRAHPGLRCSSNYPAAGVDIRANDGYIVWWPAHGGDVRDVPILEWPSSLVAQWLHKSKPISRPSGPLPQITDARVASVVLRVKHSPEGTRNKVLFWAACRFGQWVDQNEISAANARALLADAAAVCGLDYRSSIKTIDSGLNTGRT